MVYTTFLSNLSNIFLLILHGKKDLIAFRLDGTRYEGAKFKGRCDWKLSGLLLFLTDKRQILKYYLYFIY